MLITINNKEYNIPFDCEVITLGQYIDYQDLYGKELDNRLAEIITKEDNADDINDYLDDCAIAWFSFWTKLPLKEAKGVPSITPLLTAYRIMRSNLQIQESEIEFPKEYSWKGEKWQIQDFKLNPASEMDFNEIATSKELMRQIFDIGKGKLDSLVYISAIFFRKIGERFSDSMLYENSERLNMMRELPLSYAMNVSFFLSLCVSFYKQISLSSEKEAA